MTTKHKGGCSALGGFGHGVGPCDCTDQPYALRLAEALDDWANDRAPDSNIAATAVAAVEELRTQAATIAALEARLAAAEGESERKLDALLAHCPEGECPTCAEIICPHKDTLHFHHDGCPSCYQAEAAREFSPCSWCFGTGVDGDADDYGRTIDVRCGECNGSGRAPAKALPTLDGRYRETCTHGKTPSRCLGGCLSTEPCYLEKRAATKEPS